MALLNKKPTILPPLKIQLLIRKRNAVILPPSATSRALPLPPPLPPFYPSPPLLALLVSIEEEELK